jgi:hypothetical protein
VRLFALLAIAAIAGCGCPGALARSRGLPDPRAVSVGAWRVSLRLDRTLVGFPPGDDCGARTPDRRLSLVRAALVVDAGPARGATAEAPRLVSLGLRTEDGRPLGSAVLAARDGESVLIALHDGDGRPLAPGRYRVVGELVAGEARAPVEALLEVVPCAYY